MNIFVIGSGPAGLMSAISAAGNGAAVTVLEQKEKPCKKIYATGNGRCNFTNENMSAKFYRGNNPGKAYDFIEKFGRDELLGLFSSMGVMYKNINSYYYPNSEQAASIAEVLLAEAKRLSVKIITGVKVVDIESLINTYRIFTEKNNYEADRIIIAAGGKAGPVHGSDGNLFRLIKKMGHKVYKPLPALVPLKFADKKLSLLAGVRCKCRVSLSVEGEIISSDEGEIIFNKDNISGIPVMQLSRFASVALDKKQTAELYLDFFPSYSEEALNDYLRNALFSSYSSGKTAYEALVSSMNSKLLDHCLRLSGINPDRAASKAKEKNVVRLLEILKNMPVSITAACDFDKAQVTAGGVSLEDIDDKLQSVKTPGIYFAGEILDIDGCCGGYNLQWAFTTGYLAGKYAAE